MVTSYSLVNAVRLKKKRRFKTPYGKLWRIAALILVEGAREKVKVKKIRKWWVRPLFRDHDIHGAWATLIPTLREDPEEFYNFMRMWPAHFDEILERVSPFIKKNSWRKSISPGERLAITLRKFATGETNMSLQYLFRVSNQAIANIVFETAHVIWRVLAMDPTVFEPPSLESWLRISAEFEAMWDFPNCLGAADGLHVHAKAFPRTGTLFFNYKKRFSINVMAVADAKQRFIAVEAGSCGSSGDAGVFLHSQFRKDLLSGALQIPPAIPVEGVQDLLPFTFVGDNAYALTNWMQVPFKGEFLKPEELVFNYRLSRARRSVENAFGILQKRFPIIQGPIEGSYEKVKTVTLACFALHNFHLTREESLPPGRRNYRPRGYVDYRREDGTIVPGRWRTEDPKKANRILKRSRAAMKRQSDTGTVDDDEPWVRESLLELFIDQDVPWQWKHYILQLKPFHEVPLHLILSQHFQ